MNKIYPRFESGFNIHYFDRMCTIRDLNNGLYHFDYTQTNIIELIDGKKSIDDIVGLLLKPYETNFETEEIVRKKVKEFISNLYEKGLIRYNINISELDEIIITGERYKYYPRNIFIELTNACNLFCQHCFKNASNKNSTFMTDEIFYKVVDLLENKTFEIQLTGGEPLIHPRINNYLERITKNFYVSITTNGVYLHTIRGALLEKIGFIQVSMYGFDYDSYKEMTGSGNAFYSFKNNVTKINQKKINNLVTVILSQKNLVNMEKYINLAIECGVKKIKFGLPGQLGRAVENDEKLNTWSFSDDEEKSIYLELKRLHNKYKDNINVIVWNDYDLHDEHNSMYTKDNKYKEIMNSYNNECLSCGAGLYNFNVSEAGKLRACQLLPEEYFCMGDIHTIESIINNKKHNLNIKDSSAKYIKTCISSGLSIDKICHSLLEF